MSCDNDIKLNQYVGSQIRLLRNEADYNLAQLAGKLNISYQQLQKYETGVNNLSVSKLYQIAQVFGVEPSHFFPGVEAVPANIESIKDAGIRHLLNSLIHRISGL